MSFTLRAVKVPPNSASMEEARCRVFEFFRQACRAIPSIMEIYNLDDVVTPSQLRSTISKQLRKNQAVSDPKMGPGPPVNDTEKGILSKCKVIDMLLFKGMEELNNITEHAKQRHHVIGQYVVGQKGLVQDLDSKDQGSSDFLKKFYTSNYF